MQKVPAPLPLFFFLFFFLPPCFFLPFFFFFLPLVFCPFFFFFFWSRRAALSWNRERHIGLHDISHAVVSEQNRACFGSARDLQESRSAAFPVPTVYDHVAELTHPDSPWAATATTKRAAHVRDFEENIVQESIERAFGDHDRGPRDAVSL